MIDNMIAKMIYDWAPILGELYFTTDSWPATLSEIEIPKQALVLWLGGVPYRDSETFTSFLGGWVLYNGHRRWIKVCEGDLIRVNDATD